MMWKLSYRTIPSGS